MNTKSIAEKLLTNARDFNFDAKIVSKGNVHLLFHENYVSEKYANKFRVQSDMRERFDEAFIQVTNGVGNESSKINSVISSSLLSLLVFYPLFKNEGKSPCLKIRINHEDILFNKALFEVRNKVIGYPSCIDVVLQSEDKSTLLFLESKFTEPIESLTTERTYGKSYKPLYDKLSRMLKEGGISIAESKDNLILTSKTPCYIEGIKQSISHLIGLVKGPQDVDSYPYNKAYSDLYKTAYNQAERLMYATIMFDLNSLETPYSDLSDSTCTYSDLYTSIIGKHGEAILVAIRDKFKKSTKQEKITVLPIPLTYQDIISSNAEYPLSKVVKSFYNL